MISAWWLLLIIPVSASLGYVTCGIMITAKAMDIDNDTDM